MTKEEYIKELRGVVELLAQSKYYLFTDDERRNLALQLKAIQQQAKIVKNIMWGGYYANM